MTLRHLKIFLAVTRHECNTTRAAEELYMTQPAISLAIRELEEHYGVTLFDRIGRRLRITAAGERFREYAVHIVDLFDDMEKGMKDWDSFGMLRVGASITIGSVFLPNYVKAFNWRWPETEVQAFIGPSDLLERKIMDNELDFALIEGVPTNPSLISEEYMEDRLTVACPPGGKFHQGDVITVDEFRKQKFLLRERGSGTRETFEHATAAAGFSVVPSWEAMSTTALIHAVMDGLGIAVLPQRMIMGPMETGHIVGVSVEGLNFTRKFHIVWHREKYLTASANAFMDLCRNYEMDYPMPHWNGMN